MRAAEALAVLPAEKGAEERTVRFREPLPCRALVPGPFSAGTLREHLGALALPVRTAALMTGDAGELGPVEGAVVRWAAARSASLVCIFRAAEARAAVYRRDVEALTGLGPGLTPTGDDLLVGMAAMAERLQEAGRLSSRALGAFGTALAGLASTPAPTTSVALALLDNASRKRYPAVLAAVVELLGNPDAGPAAVREEVAILSSVGAHSGTDFLAGALTLALGIVFPTEAR